MKLAVNILIIVVGWFATATVAQDDPSLEPAPDASSKVRDEFKETLQNEINILKNRLASYPTEFKDGMADIDGALEAVRRSNSVETRVRAYEMLTIKLWKLARVVLESNQLQVDLKLIFSRLKEAHQKSEQEIHLAISEYETEIAARQRKSEAQQQSVWERAEALREFRQDIEAGNLSLEVKEALKYFEEARMGFVEAKSALARLQRFRQVFVEHVEASERGLEKLLELQPKIKQKLRPAERYRAELADLVVFVRHNVKIEIPKAEQDAFFSQIKALVQSSGAVRQELEQLPGIAIELSESMEHIPDIYDLPGEELNPPTEEAPVDTLAALKEIWAEIDKKEQERNNRKMGDNK